MATLSKHGAELYRYEGIAFRLSYRADGEILRDNGGGWKLWKRCKPGTDPAEFANRQRERNAQLDRDCPCFAAFREKMHSLVPFKARYWVFETLKTLPDDPDGLCTELQESSLQYSDHNPALGIDDCVELCRAYAVATREAEQRYAKPA